MRRHLHDASTLRRTLVVATRNAAALFALLQREAHAGCAEGPRFVTFGESALFPNGLPTAFTPTIADLDTNGLLDLVVRVEPAAGTSFAFYRNVGTPREPVFTLMTGSQNPFEGLPGATAGEATAPQFVDLDADGDLDLVAADPSNTPTDLLYFENTGSPSSPRFLERTGAASPFGLPLAATDPSPSFGDLDTDGDLDLVIGRVDGSLGFYENTGSAIAPAFIERAGPSNPLRLLSTASRSTPVLSDLEGDGDLDLVSGSGDGTFSYFENTGTAVSPAFMARTGENAPFRGIDLGDDSHPTVGDLDADGDPDLLAGQASGRLAYYVDDPSHIRNLEGVLDPSHSSDPLHWGNPTLADFDGDEDLDLLTHSYQAGIWRLDHYENTGTTSCPSFVVRTGGTNPFAPLTSQVGPMAFGDLDADGDLDAVVGKGTFESFGYFENTGGTEAPAFIERTGSANPLSGDVFYFPQDSATLVDLDSDGDLDLVLTQLDQGYRYLENTGSAISAAFLLRPYFGDPLPDSYSYRSLPSFVDLDADGDLDLIAHTDGRYFWFYENTGTSSMPSFVLQSARPEPIGGLPVSDFGVFALGDIDSDGDFDLVTARRSGQFLLKRNPTGDPPSPPISAWEAVGSANPFSGLDVGTHSTPTFGDRDRDGDPDLVVGSRLGLIGELFGSENTGNARDPRFAPLVSLVDAHLEQWVTAPSLGDLDHDGDLDLVSGEPDGRFFYSRNDGDAKNFLPVLVPGTISPLSGEDVGSSSAPALGDLHGRARTDLVSGSQAGTLRHYWGVGPLGGPDFRASLPHEDPVSGFALGAETKPATGDIDRDGDLDLLIGAVDGRFHYLENTGDAASPAFVERSGPANPMDGIDVGSHSAPALVDLNRDGQLDVVAGDASGAIRTFYLVEPTLGTSLAAGSLLLGLGLRTCRATRRSLGLGDARPSN